MFIGKMVTEAKMIHVFVDANIADEMHYLQLVMAMLVIHMRLPLSYFE
jgi:hypothetical protein